MKVYELFDIEYGINLELNACDITSDSSGVNFVSRTGENNGVVAKVKYIKGKIPQPSGILTCAGSGSVLSTFVQDKPFYSGRDLYTLTPKKEMSLKEKLFYCHCIKLNSYRYNYGCQANKTLRNINLPPIPKWLESYNIDYSRITTKVKRKNLPMAVNVWKEFYLKDLFDVRGTKTTKIADLERYGKGKYPYITTQATNNGAAGFYDFYTEKGNVLVIDSAVIGRCSYQGYDFSASDHVEKLIPKNIF
ncbi:MAG: restriction endonuclease subunit S, partial [Endomicrobium sp.]|nr:restriction endonuclease subunit S [Endomicrobium sp.]